MTSCTQLESGEKDLTSDAGMYQPAAIGDRVWYDENRNGLHDPGEPGIENVPVSLYHCDGTLIATTATGADGFYLFSGLPPGAYYVEFDSPEGHVFSPREADNGRPNPDERDSDAERITGRTVCTDLVSGEQDPTWDAGLFRPEPAAIGDFVWNDVNASGIQDLGEPGIENVPVSLYSCGPDGVSGTFDDTLLAATSTNADGFYLFEGLNAPGNYFVKFDAPTGYFFSPANRGGNPENDSDADPAAEITACTELTPGEIDLTWDAGLYKLNGCDLAVSAACLVTPAPPKVFDCSAAKPIDSLTMIWNGGKPIDRIDVYSDKYDANDPGKNFMYSIPGRSSMEMKSRQAAMLQPVRPTTWTG
jgi:hypothetical protein